MAALMLLGAATVLAVPLTPSQPTTLAASDTFPQSDKYGLTFVATGCCNPLPGADWWMKQNESTVFDDMYAYCTMVQKGGTSKWRVDFCGCGEAGPKACTKQAAWADRLGIPGGLDETGAKSEGKGEGEGEGAGEGKSGVKAGEKAKNGAESGAASGSLTTSWTSPSAAVSGNVGCNITTELHVGWGCDRKDPTTANPDSPTHDRPYYNNLAGKGPNFNDPQEMRYKHVGTTDCGTSIDLVVTAASEFTPYDANRTGCNGHFGQISMAVGDSVKLNFSLRDAGTDAPITPKSFHISFFDLDGGRVEQRVSLAADQFDGYELTNTTYVHVNTTAESTTFWGPPPCTTDDNGDGKVDDYTFDGHAAKCDNHFVDNPTDPYALDDDQRDISVNLLFVQRSSFEITLSVSEHPTDRYRNFFFAGASNIGTVHCDSSDHWEAVPHPAPSTSPSPAVELQSPTVETIESVEGSVPHPKPSC